MRRTNRASRAAKRYLREVRYHLPCSFKTKREMLFCLQDSLSDYVGERPHASYEDITDHFGPPTVVADAYFADIPADQLRKSLQTARFVRCILVVVCLLALLAYGMTLGMILHEAYTSRGISVTETIHDETIHYYTNSPK